MMKVNSNVPERPRRLVEDDVAGATMGIYDREYYRDKTARIGVALGGDSGLQSHHYY